VATGPFIVAIDGPAGAGKSTVSKALSARLGWALVDTGAIYRCVALAATRQGVRFDDEVALAHLLPTLEIRFRLEGGENHVILHGWSGDEDVSAAIRTPEISKAASAVSAHPAVRDGLLELQRRLARAATGGAILEGRDIGTVVFPEAQAKFFLTATSAQRAERRYKELLARGQTAELSQVLAEQNQRDRDDSMREVAPLRAAPDAVILDSTDLGLDAVVDRMAQEIQKRLQASP
jgi:cytidylate kinase